MKRLVRHVLVYTFAASKIRAINPGVNGDRKHDIEARTTGSLTTNFFGAQSPNLNEGKIYRIKFGPLRIGETLRWASVALPAPLIQNESRGFIIGLEMAGGKAWVS